MEGGHPRLIAEARGHARPRGLTVGTDPARFPAMAAFLESEKAAGVLLDHARARPGGAAKDRYAYYRWAPAE